MTTENVPQLPPPPVTEPASHPRSRVWPLWIFSLLILLAVALLGWTGWQQLQMRQAELANLQQANDQQQQRIASLEQRYQERLSSLDRRTEQAGEAVHRLDKQLSHTSQQVMSMGAKGRTDWLLAEAEYLLRLANQRLLMERDPKGALAILEAADRVLAETDDIAVYPVRRQIAQEVLSLQAVAELDRTGIFLKIEALTGLIDQLQQRVDQQSGRMVGQQSDTENRADTSRGMLNEVWAELKQLVVVRRLDEAVQPLLPPENLFFLRQNLRLMLEQAELALLERNQVLYESSLQQAEEWVQQYFTAENPQSASVAQTFVRNIAALQQLQVDPELPDISDSLRQLKGLIASLYEQHAMPKGQSQESTDADQSRQSTEPNQPRPEPSQPQRDTAPDSGQQPMNPTRAPNSTQAPNPSLNPDQHLTPDQLANRGSST